MTSQTPHVFHAYLRRYVAATLFAVAVTLGSSTLGDSAIAGAEWDNLCVCILGGIPKRHNQFSAIQPVRERLLRGYRRSVAGTRQQCPVRCSARRGRQYTTRIIVSATARCDHHIDSYARSGQPLGSPAAGRSGVGSRRNYIPRGKVRRACHAEYRFGATNAGRHVTTYDGVLNWVESKGFSDADRRYIMSMSIGSYCPQHMEFFIDWIGFRMPIGGY